MKNIGTEIELLLGHAHGSQSEGQVDTERYEGSNDETQAEASKWFLAAEAIFSLVSSEIKPGVRTIKEISDYFESEGWQTPIRTYFLFLKKAVELSPHYSPALHKLALAYLDGYGTRKSRPEALRLLRLAVAQASPEQLWRMSWDIKHETAGNRNWPEGMKEVERMCRLAAVQGHEGGQHELGEMYAEGTCGLTQNYELARYWYERSAENGQFPPAEYFLKHFRKKSTKNSK